MEPSTCDRCIYLRIRANGQETTVCQFYIKYSETRQKPPHEFCCNYFHPSRHISSDLPPWRSPDWCPHIVRNKP